MPSTKRARNSPIKADIKAEYLYMLVTADKYECPMIVTRTADDMAARLGRTLESVRSTMSKGQIVKFNGTRCVFKVVKVGNRRKQNIKIMLIKAGEAPSFIRIRNTDSAINELIGTDLDYEEVSRNNVIISRRSLYDLPKNMTLFGKEYHGDIIIAGITNNEELTDVRINEATLPLFLKLAGA